VSDDPCRAVSVERRPLPSGDAGTLATVEAMRELIHAAQSHPTVRTYAESLVRDVGPGDRPGEVHAIVAGLARAVIYRADPEDTEFLQAPWHVFDCQILRGRQPALDCDDLTVLSLSLLAALGFRTAVRVVSTAEDLAPSWFAGWPLVGDLFAPDDYSHVYGLVEVPGHGPMRVDLTYAWQPPERRARPETRAAEVAV
jgi:hypothetical protein